MKYSIVQTAVFLVAFSTGTRALRASSQTTGTADDTITRREPEPLVVKPAYYPGYGSYYPSAPYGYGGSITATGANGGYNEYGNGANGGSISVARREEATNDATDAYIQPVYRRPKSVYRRPKPVYRRPQPKRRPYRRPGRVVNVAGANGGINYGGYGANGGSIRVSRRDGAVADHYGPHWPHHRHHRHHKWGVLRRDVEVGGYYKPAKGRVNVSGANGGKNYGGNGANGGKIRVKGSSGRKSTTVRGANGGVNHGGNGANGGSISVGRRDVEGLSYYRPAKGPVNVKGANGGKNYGGNGANGGKIAVKGGKGKTTVNGANGGVNHGGNGANGGSISVD